MTSTTPLDIDALRAELLNIQQAYGRLVDSVGPEHWRDRMPSSPWTAGQMLAHMVLIHEYVPTLVAKARRQQGALNYEPWLVDTLNVLAAQWTGWRLTPEGARQRHDQATQRTLALLDAIDPGDWQSGARFFSRDRYTVERLLRLPVTHFAEHAPHVEQLLAR